LWEAFLLQMNDFDRYLEIELKDMLDHVAARRPPARRGRLKPAVEPIKLPVAVERFAVQAIPVVEPVVVVALPIAAARSL
jgi:hypothetical protein